MNNRIWNNINSAITMANYDSEALRGKSPDEVAKILHDFGAGMKWYNSLDKKDKDMLEEYKDEDGSISKENLRSAIDGMYDKEKLKAEYNREEIRKELEEKYGGREISDSFIDTEIDLRVNKDIDDLFDVFFSVFDQTGDGKMEAAELTLFDYNDKGDTGINGYTMWKTLNITSLADFPTGPTNEASEYDSTDENSSETSKKKKVRNVHDAIVNANYDNDALRGYSREEIAKFLYNFGRKMNASPEFGKNKEDCYSIDISEQMNKEELRKLMRLMYTGAEADFDQEFDIFFAVFDQDGDGVMDKSELSLFDDDTKGDSNITAKTMWRTLYVGSLENFTYSEKDFDGYTPPPESVPVDVKDLPADWETRDGKIYAKDTNGKYTIEIGTVSIEYKDTNHDGTKDIVPIYSLYEPENLPENCFMDRKGNIQEFDEAGNHTGTLYHQPFETSDEIKEDITNTITLNGQIFIVDENNITNEEGEIIAKIEENEDGIKTVTVNGHIYTIDGNNVLEEGENVCEIVENKTRTISLSGHTYTIDENNNLLDENGNKVGRIKFIENKGKNIPVPYLYPDEYAKITGIIPEDLMSIDKFGELTGTSGEFAGKGMHSESVKTFIENEKNSQPTLKVTLRNHNEGTEVEFNAGEMEPGTYDMLDKDGNVIGYMVVDNKHQSAFYVPDDFDPSCLE